MGAFRPKTDDEVAQFRARLLELFIYDEDSGRLINKLSGKGRTEGEPAGCIRKDGYVYVKVDWGQYTAHQLIWLMVYGVLVKGLDHRDKVRSNNRLGNLRPSDKSKNMQNSKMRSDNKSGVRGVSWFSKRQKWGASITVAGKFMYLGFRDSLEEAAELRKVAEVKYFGEFASDEKTTQ